MTRKAALGVAIELVQAKLDEMNGQMWIDRQRCLRIGDYPGHRTEKKRLTDVLNQLNVMEDEL